MMSNTFRRARKKRGIHVLSNGLRSDSSDGPLINVTPLLIIAFLLLGNASAWSQVACKPLLSVKDVREFRASSTPAITRRWSAKIIADARHCATKNGVFEIDFVRIKENAPDLQFTEKFRWQNEQFDVSMELNSDESVLEFRVGFISPCVCRSITQLSTVLD
jgi:hypothetical protein